MKHHAIRQFMALAGGAILVGSIPANANAVCGDSEPNTGEECDDGNMVSGDGCSSTCSLEPGFECTEAIAGVLTENILVDGSFEDGNIGGEWTSIGHSLFGPDLICGDGCFGTPFAAGPDENLISGNYVLLAGGSFTSSSTGNATHAAVQIPANATTLEFQWGRWPVGSMAIPVRARPTVWRSRSAEPRCGPTWIRALAPM